MNEFDPYKTLANPVSAGVLGSFISLNWAPGKRFVHKLINFFSSCVIVYYTAPGFVDFFNIHTDAMASLISLFIGMFGLNLSAQISEGVRQTQFSTIITSWLRKK